jgi:hypothetical protein
MVAWWVDAVLWTLLELADPQVAVFEPYMSTTGEWRT